MAPVWQQHLLLQRLPEEEEWRLPFCSDLHHEVRQYHPHHSDDFDTVYVAHCYPYTYTQLCRYLRSIEHDPTKKGKFQRRTLCQSESGNQCDYLVIGEYGNNLKDKKAIVITCRVHPGETMVSYIM